MSDKPLPTPQPVRLTPDEKRLYGQLFRIADSGQVGVITGAVAVEFFKKSGLTPTTLAEIWTIADTDNQGFLTQRTWSIALRLISHAQKGEKPTPEMANKPGPPFPVFEGIQLPTPPPPPPVPNTPVPSNRVPPLGPAERERYRNMFANTGARDGLLDGEQARTIFLRARLPNETLGQIWSLADIHNRGALDITEFTIAMHLIQSFMSNLISTVPATLPPELFQAASIASPAASQFTQGTIRRTPSVSSTGSGRAPQVPPKIIQSPIRTDFTGGSQTSIDGWDITPQDKSTFDDLFRKIDTANKGYIDGNEAVGFFLTSKLPEDLLAHIWDLSDIQKQGKLTRDTFAVAMYLIRLKISGKDIPPTLPASLVPPSLRQSVPSTPAQLPVLQQSPPTSAAQDLFGLDNAFGPSVPAATVSPASAFTTSIGSPPRTIAPNKVVSSPKPSSPVLSAPLPRPFQPQSEFGRGIATPPLKPSTPAQSFPSPQSFPKESFPPIQPPISNFNQQFSAPIQIAIKSGSVFGDQDRDLLGDADPEISQKLTAETTELANLSNQIGSLNTATRDLQSNKARAETELASVSQQKRDIEARLKQIRSLYDAEVNSVKQVETQLTTVRGELVKNRQEVTILEASLRALQSQVAEQRGTLQKDQAENTTLKSRIAAVGEETKQLKEILEKVKRDARQQRGMVAINKKQLSTIEGERDKVQGDIEGEKKALESLLAESTSVPRDVVSPVGNERSGTNPFLRMQSTGDAFSPPATFFPQSQSFSPPQSISPPQTLSPPQSFSIPFHESSFSNAFDDAFPAQIAEASTASFPPTQKPEQLPQPTRESILEQPPPPSIASALSPPLTARDFPAHAETTISRLAVNAPPGDIGSMNGDILPPHASAEIIPKEERGIPGATGIISTVTQHGNLPVQDGPVVSDVQETEVKGSNEEIESPKPLHIDTTPTEQVSHEPQPSGVVKSDIVQETLSHRPRDEDLGITSLEQKAKDVVNEPEKVEEKPDEIYLKGASLPSGFPSESSDEGRESWVDLGDESKSLPSEQHPPITSTLPSNRSDPFAFSASSAPPKVATKEDLDAAFSSFGKIGNKDTSASFDRDFNSEFPPIEQYGGDESDSEDETAGFNDNFAEKGNETADTSGIATNGKSVETPLQQTLPTSPPVETAIKNPPIITTPDATAVLREGPPPVPPKDAMAEVPSAPPITPSQTPPPETGANPPPYFGYSNQPETSSGSDDLSGLPPRRGEPHMSAAPYTSPPQEIFSAPTSFTPVQPVSFSPPLPSRPKSFTPPPVVPSTAQSASSFPPPQSSLPSPPQQKNSFPFDASAKPALPPKIEEPKPAQQTQSFDAFDFSGLQDAAPLDESQDDPFRLSTRSDTFGEFDTSFDSAPVIPAKVTIPAPPPQSNEFNNFNWEEPPDFNTSPEAPRRSIAAGQIPSSNFDDVFSAFDRPLAINPPELPLRQTSQDDLPDLKTLTEMGFTRSKAVEALEKNKFNLAAATNYLLEH